MLYKNRPSIPSGLKRRLRQEAGYGCCFCGYPFLEYHHIVPWSEDQHFRPEDMMVVCSRCHGLCTVHAISENEQRRAKHSPKNVVDGETRGRLYVNSDKLIVNVGGGQAINTPELLKVHDETLLAARLSPEDGRVLLSAKIQSRANGIVGELVDNEWVINTLFVWDAEVYARSATFRQSHGDIMFRVDARNDQIELAGNWYHNRVPIKFDRSEITVGTTKAIAPKVTNSQVFVQVYGPG